MNLRKWTSNNQELLDSLPEELTERALQSFGEYDTTKALGLQWNPRTDEFTFNVAWEIQIKQLTKRQKDKTIEEVIE